MIEALFNNYMKEDSERKYIWRYVECIMLKAIEGKYHLTNDKKYFDFIKHFIDHEFVGDEISQIKLDYHSTDQIKMADMLYLLFEETMDVKYEKYIHLLYRQLTTTFPRIKMGNFWHKDNYPNQVWLDGLYMVQPFYAKYIKMYHEHKNYDDVIMQFLNVRKTHYQSDLGIYVHAYEETKTVFWADKKTGQSTYAWARASGWLAMALVDVIEIIDDKKVAEPLEGMFKELIDDLKRYQDKSGLWHQIIDLTDRADNYLETSATAMISFAILKAIRLNIIDKSYKDMALKAFEGIQKLYLRKIDGNIELGGICKSAGLGINPDTGIFRDGSYEYYVKREPVVTNNGHGVAPFLMIYNELSLYR